MKENWTYKKLGEIASFINGYAFKPEQWKENGVPIIRIQNLNNPDAPYNYYDGEVPDKVKVKEGDLLISWSATLGVYIWHGCDAFLNQHIFKVEFDKLDVEKMYLKYAVASKLDAMASLVHGATMKHIVKKDFDNTLIPIPPMEEQERIVAELDLLQSVIDKKKAQLDEYDKLAQSIFYEMFGDPIDNPKKWEVKKLGEIGECISGGTPSRKRTDYFSGNINWFSAGELNSLFLTDSVEKITQEALDSSAAKLCKPMSLFIGMYDTAAFKLGIPTIESTSNQACANVSLYQDNIIWLYYVLLLMKDEALKHRHGARQKNLNLNYIKNFEIPLPPLSLQQSFAEKIEAIEHQKELVKQSLNEVKTLFDSRMDYYFN